MLQNNQHLKEYYQLNQKQLCKSFVYLDIYMCVCLRIYFFFLKLLINLANSSWTVAIWQMILQRSGFQSVAWGPLGVPKALCGDPQGYPFFSSIPVWGQVFFICFNWNSMPAVFIEAHLTDLQKCKTLPSQDFFFGKCNDFS